MAKRDSQPSLTRNRLPRAQREALLQRVVLIGAIVVAVAVVALVSVALVSELIVKPNRTAATVNGEEITADAFQQEATLTFLIFFQGQLPPSQTGGDPLISFGRQVLDNMILREVVEAEAEAQGISVSEEEVREEFELLFGYDAGDPEPTVTPFPTLEGADSTPTITPTFILTYTPTPTLTLPPEVTPTATGTPTATPDPDATATPTVTPQPTPTPLDEEAFVERSENYIESVATFPGVDATAEEIEAFLIQRARTTLLRDRLFEAFEADVETTNEFAQIFLMEFTTEEDAQAALERIEEGETFTEVAVDVSEDIETAFKGGNLGWLTEQTVESRYNEDFTEAVFDNEVGEVSGPIEVNQQWFLVMVMEREERDAAPIQIEQRRQVAFQEHLDELREEATITISDEWPELLRELPLFQQAVQQQQQPQFQP